MLHPAPAHTHTPLHTHVMTFTRQLPLKKALTNSSWKKNKPNKNQTHTKDYLHADNPKYLSMHMLRGQGDGRHGWRDEPFTLTMELGIGLLAPCFESGCACVPCCDCACAPCSCCAASPFHGHDSASVPVPCSCSSCDPGPGSCCGSGSFFSFKWKMECIHRWVTHVQKWLLFSVSTIPNNLPKWLLAQLQI